MTLFTYDSDEAEHKTIENLICSTLNDPDFAGNTHPAITSLKCITSDTAFPGIVPNNDLNKVEPGSGGSNSNFVTPASVAASLASVMVVFGVGYAYRRRSKDTEQIPITKGHLDDSDINNSNSISIEELPMAWSTQTRPNQPAFDMQSIIPKGYSPPVRNNIICFELDYQERNIFSLICSFQDTIHEGEEDNDMSYEEDNDLSYDEEQISSNLDEVSLDQLSMNLGDVTDLS